MPLLHHINRRCYVARWFYRTFTNTRFSRGFGPQCRDHVRFVIVVDGSFIRPLFLKWGLDAKLMRADEVKTTLSSTNVGACRS